jgi:hypothetical protein
MIYFDRVVGFDPNGIGRVYASTSPLSAWRFELLDQKLQFSSPLHLDRPYGAPSMPRWR